MKKDDKKKSMRTKTGKIMNVLANRALLYNREAPVILET